LISQLDFYCAPLWQLGGIGFIFLVGIVVGCSTLTKMGDYYGRRPVFMLGFFMNFVCITALIFSHNVIFDYFVLFGLGLSIAARYYVGYAYNVEMCPKAQ
jgi:MFS family permease